MIYHERKARKKGYSIVVGIDEVGRGPLAGPLVVAAVYLKTFSFKARVDDSKKLTANARRKAFDEIVEKGIYGLGIVNEGAIDTIRMSAALNVAADTAVKKLLARIKKPKPTFRNTFLLRDGSLPSNLGFSSKEIIGGDGKSLSIAAASIIAKVVRDRIMEIYDSIWPAYGFRMHKGYGTSRHIEAISRLGLSPIHRKTFCANILGKCNGRF